MSKDKALEHLEAARPDGELDAGARERRTALAQAEATLYVGEQLERIADMIAGGFFTGEGNYGGWVTRPTE